MADIKISELERVQSLNNGDLVEVSQEDSYSETGYSSKSAKMTDLGEKVVNGIEYTSELNTSNKKIIGAINEIASYTPVYGNTASGAIATFDTSLALPLQDCTIAINAVQESGTPTPSSPKAITGFTGANIHVADDETPHIIDNVTSITWQDEAGTVYGGSLDVTSGVLNITHYGFTVDNDTVMYSPIASWTNQHAFQIEIPYPAIQESVSVVPSGLYCNISKTISVNDVIWNATNDNSISIRRDICFMSLQSCNSISDARTFLMNNNVFIVYALETPITVQLTPTQITAIVSGGAKTTNNVFTDTNGNTSVVYACSLKDYIDRQ